MKMSWMVLLVCLVACGEASVDRDALDSAGIAAAGDTDCNQFNTGDGASNNVQNCGSGQIGDNSDNGNTTTSTTCSATDHSQGRC